MMPLDGIESEVILWVVAAAEADGIAVQEVADWSKARVVHMRGPLQPELKARIQSRWPDLTFYADRGDPHYAPDEGFIDGGFAVSFPVVPAKGARR